MEDIKGYVLDKLKEHSGQLREISKSANVPYPTLLKINQQYIKNPGINHMQALYNHFKSFQ